tara:strand:- start:6687 stop:6983 length:297 start_codon:yes stop_codon:yes gene_type:complete
MESKHLRFWGSVILASGVFVLFGIIIPNNLWVLISIPIMLMVAGIALIISAFDKESKTNTNRDTLNSSSSTVETPARTKTDGFLSHDSEEYRRWKEGK